MLHVVVKSPQVRVFQDDIVCLFSDKAAIKANDVRGRQTTVSKLFKSIPLGFVVSLSFSASICFYNVGVAVLFWSLLDGVSIAQSALPN